MGFTVDSDDNVATIFFDGSPIGTILFMSSNSSGAEFVVNGLRVRQSDDYDFGGPIAYLSSIGAGGALDMPKEEWLRLGGYDDIFDDQPLASRHAQDEDEDEDVCDTPGCSNRLDDGEGYDGYCGECADKKEEEGYWASRHAADTWNNRDVEKYLRSAGWELAPGDPIFPDVAGNSYVLGDREIWVSAVQTGFRIDGVDGPFVSPFDSSTGPAFSWDEVTEAISGVTASRHAEMEDVEVTCEEIGTSYSADATWCGEPFYAYDYDGTPLCRGHYDAAAQRREMGWAGGPYGDYQQ